MEVIGVELWQDMTREDQILHTTGFKPLTRAHHGFAPGPTETKQPRPCTFSSFHRAQCQSLDEIPLQPREHYRNRQRRA